MADIKPPAPRKPMVDPLEAKRLEQPCLRTIDLRPERGKRCRAYPHGGRTHWLDDAAIAAFEQALVEFKGRYTIGVYERTLASDAAQAAPAAAVSSREPNTISEDAIRRIPFGYRPHRHESRLNFVSAISIELDGDSSKTTNKTIAGKTLDLSLLGVRVQIAASDDIPANSKVLVHYLELQQRADEPLGSIAYTVLGSDRDGDRKLLRLKRIMRATEHVFDAFVPSFIEHQLARYKIELKDALPATYARIYERLYSQRAWFAEAFFALDQERPELLFVTTAADWQREQDLQVLPQLAARLAAGASSAEWAQQQQATTQAALHYWLRTERGDYLVPASALTPLRRAEWQTLAAHAVAVASIGQRQKPLDPGQIEQALELLPDELAPTVLAWQQRLQRQQYGLAIVPLGPLPNAAHTLAPEWLRDYLLTPNVLAPNTLTANSPTSERQQAGHAPLTALGIRGARAQERFRYRTPMLLHTEDGREFAGESLDFSINGLGLELHSDIGLTPREWLRVSFPVLQQKVKEPEELADQPYRVVRQLGRRLTLERDFRVVGHRAARFFAHIIQQNRGRLPVCHNERQETAESQLSEQVLVRGLIGCPLFLARDQDKHPQLLALAHHHGSAPGAPFDGAQAAAVLAALADLPVLYDLLAGICNAVGAVEKVAFHKLLLTPATAATPPRWQVLPRNTSLEQFKQLLRPGCQLFQLILTPVPNLPRRELDDALLPILGNSRHRANEFRSELSRLVGIATLFDITQPASIAVAQNLPL